MICPNCKSEKCQFVSETSNNGFSMGDGCCGMLLLGPFGLLCGLCGSGSETNTYWKCATCGKQFQDAEGMKVPEFTALGIDNSEIIKKHGDVVEGYRGLFANNKNEDVYLFPNLNYDIINQINQGLESNEKEALSYDKFIVTYGNGPSWIQSFLALTDCGLIWLYEKDGILIVELFSYEKFIAMPTYESGWLDRKIHFNYLSDGIYQNITLEMNTNSELDKAFYDILIKVYWKNVQK